MCRVKPGGGRMEGHDYSRVVILMSIMFDGISKHLHNNFPNLCGEE